MQAEGIFDLKHGIFTKNNHFLSGNFENGKSPNTNIPKFV